MKIMTHEDLRSVTRLHFLTCSFEMQFHYELIVAEEEEVVIDSFSYTCSMIETFHKRVDDPEF